MKHVTGFRFKKADIGVFSTSAKPAVDRLEKGGSVIGLTDGSFSLIDLLREILERTGPADVVSASWSAGIKDLTNIRSGMFSNPKRIF